MIDKRMYARELAIRGGSLPYVSKEAAWKARRLLRVCATVGWSVDMEALPELLERIGIDPVTLETVDYERLEKAIYDR